MMEALEVRFELRTPMIEPATVKSLDALLAWASVQRAHFHGHDDPWQEQHFTGIAVHRVGEAWCPMASALEIEWADTSQPIHYFKRQSPISYAEAWSNGLLKKRPYFDQKRGSTKAGSYVQSARWTRGVRAWAMVEDRPLFESLLPWVTHIGKLHHKDFGAVRSFQILPNEEAQSRWAQRTLPVGSLFATKQHVLSQAALVSPYWDRRNFRPVLSFCP